MNFYNYKCNTIFVYKKIEYVYVLVAVWYIKIVLCPFATVL
jgi:hypothetical protein